MKKFLKWIQIILLSLFSLSLCIVLLYKYVPVICPMHLISHKVSNIFSSEEVDIKHQWIAIDSISPDLIQAVVASEDPFYLLHKGFDYNKQETDSLLLMQNRYYSNRGTISCQTARMVFLTSSDNYLNYLLETYFTLLIEFVWGKERIMEVYLNSILLSDGIYGINAFVDRWNEGSSCGIRTPESLSANESALIATLISNPKEDINSPSAYMLRHQVRIISMMKKTIPVKF